MADNGTRRCCGSRKKPSNADIKNKVDHPFETLPGAAIDSADHEHPTPAEVKERTHTLNNNPRDTDAENM